MAITAKDKLRRLLGKDVDLAGGSIVFSAERADQCTPGVNGIEGVLDIVGLPLSDVYSPELSLFVLEAGIKILERYSPDIMYLSLTDFVQHTWAPGEPEAQRFPSEAGCPPGSPGRGWRCCRRDGRPRDERQVEAG